MPYQAILLDIEDGVANLTLNRPEKLNALNDPMADELIEVFGEIQRDDRVRVLVITGAGRAFCSGADIKERFLPKMEKKKRGELWGEVIQGFTYKCCLALKNITKPVIASINGIAFGFGSTLTLTCDIRIASEEAKMAFGFGRMAITPEFGSTYLLPRLVGIAKACELIFTGRTIDAWEAKEIGLVNQVVPAAQLKEITRELAVSIAQGAPIALQLSKQLLYQGLDCDLFTQLRAEAFTLESCRGTQDHEEAVKAFLEKRKPEFRGR